MFRVGQALRAMFSSSNVLIPKEKLEIKAVRSSGPGGQHVNTTNSKVEIRFNVWQADWLDQETKKRLHLDYGQYMTKNGDMVVTSQTGREQQANQREALSRLQDMIYQCQQVSIPREKIEHAKVNDHMRHQKRQAKIRRSDIKKTRNMKW